MRRVILVLILAAPLFLSADQPYVPKENEEIYGNWVNTDYSGGYTEEQKIVIAPGGCEFYGIAEFEIHSGKDEQTIVDKWIDSEGNIWYKRHVNASYGEWIELDKISDNGTTLEYVISFVLSKYPTKIDPKHKDYRIYYRQK